MQQVAEGLTRFDLLKQKLLPWAVCFAASLFFFYEFVLGNMFSSIADEIMLDFQIKVDKMTYLSSIYYLSNVAFLFVSGILLDRFSTKKTMIAAMLISVLSTFLLAYAHSFYLAMACRFMTGIGSAFCFLGPIRIASRWFPPKKMALVSGAIVTMAMLGGMLAQYPLARLVELFGWRDSVLTIGWLGVAMLGVMILGIMDRPEVLPRQSNGDVGLLTLMRKSYLNPQTLRAGLYTSLMNMPTAVLGAMIGQLYLVHRLGISKEVAAMINSMLFLGMIVGGPLIGWCSDKLRLRVWPMKVGSVAALLIVLSIVYLPVSPSGMACLFFLLGFVTSSQVISYALVAESCTQEMTATALSVISILTQGGYILYQNLFSMLLLHHGDTDQVSGMPVYLLSDYQTAVLILPIGFVIAWCVLSKLKETYCRPLQG